MNKEQAIEQLKDLRDDFASSVNLHKDVEALDLAIKALEGTAPEVPVQEQPKFIPSTSDGICSNGKSIRNPL